MMIHEEFAAVADVQDALREAAPEPMPPAPRPDHLSIPPDARRRVLHIPVSDGFVLPL